MMYHKLEQWQTLADQTMLFLTTADEKEIVGTKERREKDNHEEMDKHEDSTLVDVKIKTETNQVKDNKTTINSTDGEKLKSEGEVIKTEQETVEVKEEKKDPIPSVVKTSQSAPTPSVTLITLHTTPALKKSGEKGTDNNETETENRRSQPLSSIPLQSTLQNKDTSSAPPKTENKPVVTPSTPVSITNSSNPESRVLRPIPSSTDLSINLYHPIKPTSLYSTRPSLLISPWATPVVHSAVSTPLRPPQPAVSSYPHAELVPHPAATPKTPTSKQPFP